MEKILKILFFCVSLIAMSYSCSKDEPAEEPEMIVSVEELKFSKVSEAKSMYVKSNVPWSAVSSESWCTLNPSSGKGSETTKIDVSVAANTATASRTASVTIKAGNLTKQFIVTQEKNEVLTVTPKTIQVKPEGEDITIAIQASELYSVKMNATWINSLESSATQLKFRVAANTSIFDRSTTITISLGSLEEVVAITQPGVQKTIASDRTGMDSDAPALAAKIKVGWNLGNSLEAYSDATTPGETAWGNPKTTKAFIDAVKSAGFNAVRIPCAWNGYIEDQTTSRIKDSWIARVKEVVSYCTDNNMYVILNIHWDGGWLENNPTFAKQAEVNKKQKALWEQIAVAFRDYDEHLLFAGTNEVHASTDPIAENFTVQMSFNQTFVDAVRSTGGKNTYRNLVVQSYNTNITQARDYLKMPTDPTANRMMAEVHYYDPWDFCGLEADASWATVKYFWGKRAGNDKYGEISNWGQEDWVDEAFGIMKTHFVDKGIPVVLGEYAVTLRSTLPSPQLENHIKSRNYYLNYVTKAARANGLLPFYWDNGNTGNNGSGLFNRTSGQQVHPDAIQAIVN